MMTRARRPHAAGGKANLPRGRGLGRRRFLLGGAGLLGAGAASLAGLSGAGALSRLARAAEAASTPLAPGAGPASVAAADRYFIFCYFPGGWDILLGLDPRDPAAFHGGNLADTRIQPGYELLESSNGALVDAGKGRIFGPHIGDLAAHASKLCVVRGMSMDTLTHEAGMRRFLTGKPPAGLLARGSNAATWLAAAVGQGDAVPNLSVRVESYNRDQPSWASALQVQGVPDLVQVLSPSERAMAGFELAQVDLLLAEHAACPAPAASPLQAVSEEVRLGARVMVDQGLDGLFAFQANTPEMAAKRDHYGIAASGSAALTRPGAQAALAAAALKGGVARVVSVRVSDGLDTHFDDWAEDQGPRQEEGFTAIARLLEDLAASEYKGTGTSWLDHTTVVGFSEFSRTPLLNDRGGRDHSLTNACFLAGGGVAGGTIVGASSDIGMSPQAVDLATGQLDPSGEILKPEHVHRTLMSLVDGFEDDPADLRVEPVPALLS